MQGKLILYELPEDWSEEEFDELWRPKMERDEQGRAHLLRSARLSDEQKARWAVLEAENMIMNRGMTQILNNLSVPGVGQMQPFGQVLSLGNGAITGITRTDTGVSGDGFGTNSRKTLPASSLISFHLVIVSVSYAGGDANGTLTNGGLYGVNASTGQQATTSAGTGQLNTHVMLNYPKGGNAIAIDYVFIIKN